MRLREFLSLHEGKKVSQDMKGEKHANHGKNDCPGTFKETSQHDDMQGVLHCDECDKKIERYSEVNEGVLSEGTWILKNKDGKEKRFKDDQSEAAIAWKNSSSPTKKENAKKYSYDWWDNQDAYDDRPWSKITFVDNMDQVLKNAPMGRRDADDWTFGKHYDKMVGDVPVAGRVVRLMYQFTKDDDLGIDDVDGVEHHENIGIIRDVKNPKKFIFDGYK